MRIGVAVGALGERKRGESRHPLLLDVGLVTVLAGNRNMQAL
jgi:hypothetical protein